MVYPSSREMVGYRCATAGRQGPGQFYAYQPGEGHVDGADTCAGGQQGGASLAEITETTGRQRHSVRGFMANAGLGETDQNLRSF